MKKYAFFIIILLTLSSCVRMAFKSAGLFEDKVTVNKLYNNDKEVYFLELQHFGRKEYYSDLKKKVDSLQKKNVSLFYESVIYPDYLTKEDKITLVKKHRKLSGSSGNIYLDTLTNKLYGKYKMPKKYDLINQPANEELYDLSKATNVDAQLDSLLIKFENLYGKVELSECDKQTDLYDMSYDCETLDRKARKIYSDSIALYYRNSIIVDKVLQSSSNKIAIVYGKFHYKGVKEMLKEQGYKEDLQ